MVETLAWASIGHPAFLGDLGQGPQVGHPASVCSVWKWGSHCPCPRPLLGVPALVPGRGEDSPKENGAEVLRELTSRTSMVPARPVFQSLQQCCQTDGGQGVAGQGSLPPSSQTLSAGVRANGNGDWWPADRGLSCCLAQSPGLGHHSHACWMG